jgi:hypothetical protein
MLPIAALVLVGAACTVQQTEEGEVPDIDVNVEEGKLPEYDVDMADVRFGVTEKEITVPDIDVDVNAEKQTIKVPYIDFQMPDATAEKEEQTIAVELDVPHAGYDIEIEEIRMVDGDMWVVSRLEESGTTSDDGPSRVTDRVVINAPEGYDVEHVIIGTKPEGTDAGDYRFVMARDAVATELDGGVTVYSR